jgi:hypothetical protein
VDEDRWNGPQVRGSGWLEWRLPDTLGGTPGNRFDPAAFDAWCEFDGPGGERVRATAFFDRDERGAAWVLRLLPPARGRWRARPFVRHAGAPARALGAAFEFDVARLVSHRHIGVDPAAQRHFAFEDGTPYVPVGLNVCWSAGAHPLEDYRRWFTRLAAHGGNFARLWMASWSFGIEWDDTGLGDYGARLPRAALLDAVFELAESLGIRLMLCLLNHGAFTQANDSEWARNPYNRSNGGPLAAPQDFVTDEAAQALFERRLRYIAARWSHSPALHSWEWWNEVTWTPIANAALRPWLQRMERTLAAHDPYGRLRSTSWADRGDALAWRLPALAFAQQHDYTTRDPLLHYADAARAWRADGVTDKPLLAGELGLETTFDPTTPRPFEWDAVHLHNGLWAPLFHGYAGTALYWWWDKLVDPQDLWPAFGGVARWLESLHACGLRLGLHEPHPAAFSGRPARALALALAASDSVLLWVRADLHDAGALQRAWRAETGDHDPARPWRPRFPRIEGGQVTLADLRLADGPLQLRWLDAASGVEVATGTVQAKAGVLILPCPPFERDLAAIVHRHPAP